METGQIGLHGAPVARLVAEAIKHKQGRAVILHQPMGATIAVLLI